MHLLLAKRGMKSMYVAAECSACTRISTPGSRIAELLCKAGLNGFYRKPFTKREKAQGQSGAVVSTFFNESNDESGTFYSVSKRFKGNYNHFFAPSKERL